MRESTLRFLIDLNVGHAVAAFLRANGHDVVFVGETNPRMLDVDILHTAESERRIVITMDSDFGELVYRSSQPHAGVLLLRMPEATAGDKVEVVGEIVSLYGDSLLHSFSVYRNGRLRIRR